MVGPASSATRRVVMPGGADLDEQALGGVEEGLLGLVAGRTADLAI